MTEHHFDPATGAASPAVASPSPHNRPIVWPWLCFVAGAVLLVSVLWRATAPPPLPEPRSVTAADANGILGVIQREMTTTARLMTPTPRSSPVGPVEVYIVGIAPEPTNTPFPRKATSTPWPECPEPGALCEWPEPPAPTRIAPTSTPYPVCSTPIPGERCADTGGTTTEATPDDDCRIVHGGILVCTPAAGSATADPCGNPFGGPWPTLSPEFATITPTWSTPEGC